MERFINSVEQLETCISMLNPLAVSIAIDEESNEIIASLDYPKYPEVDTKVVFDVYLVDKHRFERMQGVSMEITPIEYSYRLSVDGKTFDSKGGSGKTILKKIDKDVLLTGYTKVLGYLQTELDNSSEAVSIAKALESVKLYAVGYVVVSGDTIRPNRAMKEYSLEEEQVSDYDSLILESIKSNIDAKFKDEVHFAKSFMDVKDMKVVDVIDGHSVQALALPNDGRFFVRVG